MMSKTSDGFLESATIETAHLNGETAEKSWLVNTWGPPTMFNYSHPKTQTRVVYKLKALMEKKLVSLGLKNKHLRENCGYSHLTQAIIM